MSLSPGIVPRRKGGIKYKEENSGKMCQERNCKQSNLDYFLLSCDGGTGQASLTYMPEIKSKFGFLLFKFWSVCI